MLAEIPNAQYPLSFGGRLDPDEPIRLGKQALRVFAYMRCRQWCTLSNIELSTGIPQASVSARLRDFRKPPFGSHTVDVRRRKGAAQREYRLTVNLGANMGLFDE